MSAILIPIPLIRFAEATAPPKMPRTLDEEGRRVRFEAVVLPHFDAAYNLARWLTRHDDDAEDVVQTACLRALRFFDGFAGGNPRGWLLTIVRNTFYSWVAQHREHELATPFDEEIHTAEHSGGDPEAELLRQADAELLRQGFAALPVQFREVMVLREIEGLSYKEIAAIAGIPIGTVMSRLARARRHLQDYLIEKGAAGGRS
ncbi:MAG TPA: sigma-70 family RNA polymerase sigma factor [Thermoanaerobaculia bacterium]|nr:sigma-70 family RNA polymerase sigma factor [Thermoanaerobaculia bacterium]